MSPQLTPNVAPRAAQLATEPPSAGKAQPVTRTSGLPLGSPLGGLGRSMVTVASVTSHGLSAAAVTPLLTDTL